MDTPSVQSLRASLRQYGDTQRAFAQQNAALLRWMVVPTLAFVGLHAGFWGVVIPSENEQSSYAALLLRTVVFVGILWAATQSLRKACTESACPPDLVARAAARAAAA